MKLINFQQQQSKWGRDRIKTCSFQESVEFSKENSVVSLENVLVSLVSLILFHVIGFFHLFYFFFCDLLISLKRFNVLKIANHIDTYVNL